MDRDERDAKRGQRRNIYAGSREEEKARFLDKGPEELRTLRDQLFDHREKVVQVITRKNADSQRLRELRLNPGTTAEQLSEAEARAAASESRLAEVKVEMAEFDEIYHRQSRDFEVRGFPPTKRDRAMEIVLARDQMIEDLMASHRETGTGVHIDHITAIKEAGKRKLKDLFED